MNEKELYAGRVVDANGERYHLFLIAAIREHQGKRYPSFQGVLIDPHLRTSTVLAKGSSSNIAERWWLGCGQVDIRGLTTRTNSTGSTIREVDFDLIIRYWHDWHLSYNAPQEVYDLIESVFA